MPALGAPANASGDKNAAGGALLGEGQTHNSTENGAPVWPSELTGDNAGEDGMIINGALAKPENKAELLLMPATPSTASGGEPMPL